MINIFEVKFRDRHLQILNLLLSFATNSRKPLFFYLLKGQVLLKTNDFISKKINFHIIQLLSLVLNFDKKADKNMIVHFW